MPKRHVVTQGECLASLAREHGFANWRALADHPDNAELKQRRPNPNVLAPGDEVVIPDKTPKKVSIATGSSHRFVVKREKPRLRVRVRDLSGAALAGRPYVLEIGGARIEGKTDGNGLVDQPVAIGARTAKLTVRVDDEDPPHELSWNLRIGELDPASELSGVQGRLANLGLYAGPIDGTMNDETAAALRAFQRGKKLDETGELDDKTQSALRSHHDEDA